MRNEPLASQSPHTAPAVNGLRLLFCARRPDIREEPPLARAELPVIQSGLAKAERSVRPSPDGVRVRLVLAVVLPVAHLADVVSAAIIQRLKAAARAGIAHTFHRG